jgi:hypothetical protein
MLFSEQFRTAPHWRHPSQIHPQIITLSTRDPYCICPTHLFSCIMLDFKEPINLFKRQFRSLYIEVVNEWNKAKVENGVEHIIPPLDIWMAVVVATTAT